MRFTDLCERVFGVAFTPAQWVLFSVLFDGIDPSALAGDRRDLARRIFGDVAEVPALARRVVVIAKGARIGGTRFAATRLLHLAATLPTPPLGPGERLYGLVVGPDLRLARQALNYALGAAQSHPDLAARVRAVTADAFEFERDDGITVVIECLPATRGGSAVRGRTLVGALMTEAAFFRDSTSIVNDEEVYRAVLPRIVRGGQLIIESTLWASAGLLYQLFRDNHGKPTTALIAHAPTLLMRPDEEMRAHVEAERVRDRANAEREFDARFLAVGESTALPADDVRRMVRDIHPSSLTLGRAIAISDKSSGANDAEILAVARAISEPCRELPYLEEERTTCDWQGRPSTYRYPRYDAEGRQMQNPAYDSEPTTRILVTDMLEYTGAFREHMTFDDVIAAQAKFLERHEVKRIVGDLHLAFAAEAAYGRFGLSFEAKNTTARSLSESLSMLRMMLRDGTLVMLPSPEADRTVQDLLALQSVVLPGGESTTRSRRTNAGHGDRASVLLLLARCLSEADGMLVPGSPYAQSRRVLEFQT